MRRILALVLVLDATAAMAQSKPPTVGGRPLLQIKSHSSPPKHQSIAAKLQACLDIDDQTKERLNCYDAIFPAHPKPMKSAAKGVADCRFTKEEDERLTCFNGFAERIPKLPE
jgi:Mg2+ and Co2+ transporter CorA